MIFSIGYIGEVCSNLCYDINLPSFKGNLVDICLRHDEVQLPSLNIAGDQWSITFYSVKSDV